MALLFRIDELIFFNSCGQVRAGPGELHCSSHESEPSQEAEGGYQAAANDEQRQDELRLLEVIYKVLHGQKLSAFAGQHDPDKKPNVVESSTISRTAKRTGVGTMSIPLAIGKLKI